MATPGPGLSLIPENGAARTALAQQLVCWSKQNNGQIDPRIRFLTCKGIGYYYIPPAVCTAGYGPFPFTSEGNEIVCNPDATHQMDRTIWPEDVLPIDPNTCTTENIQLATPVITSATPTDGGATIVWDGVPGAATYNVRYKTPQATSWTTGPVVTAPTTTVDLTGLTNGQEYIVQVQAANPEYKDSQWSVSTSVTPAVPPPPLATPTGLAGTPGNGTATMTWDAVAGAGGYLLEWTANGGGGDSGPVPAGTTTHTFDNLTNDLAINVTIKALGVPGVSSDSPASAAVTVTPTAGG